MGGITPSLISSLSPMVAACPLAPANRVSRWLLSQFLSSLRPHRLGEEEDEEDFQVSFHSSYST